MNERLLALQELMRDPLNNLVATTLALAIVVLLVLIAVLILLLWVLARQGPKRRRRRAAPRQGSKRRGIAAGTSPIWGLTAFGLFVVSIGSAYVMTSANTYCTSTCHTMSKPSSSWKRSSHKTVDCVRCHEGRAVVSAPTGLAMRTRDIYYQLARVDVAGMAVPEDNCLSCHRKLASEVLKSKQGVRMAHEHVIDAGMTCEECHPAAGHSKSARVSMSRCLPCHDGETASVSCDTCHLASPDQSILVRGESNTLGQAVELPEKPTCGGCHDERKCDACHGLRMPHPDDFKNPVKHARLAAWELKAQVCARCHQEWECFDCHTDFDAHGPLWKAEHSQAPDGTWCLGCHEPANMCAVCHD